MSGPTRVLRTIDLGLRIPITGNPDMSRLGEAVDAVFASDSRDQEPEQRLARTQAILERWSVSEISADDLIACVDRFHDYLDEHYPKAQIRREVPALARKREQIISGRIDLLIETAGGFSIFDHKSFHGNRSQREAAAIACSPQLQLYADAVTNALNKECQGLFIHTPISG